MGGMGGGGGGMGGMGSYIQMIMQALAGIGQAVSIGVYDNATEDSTDDIRDLMLQMRESVEGLAGDLDFPEVEIDPLSLLFAFANPNANPALSASTVAALQGLGMPISGVMQEGSPQARLVNQLGAMNLTKQQFDQNVKFLAQGGKNKKGVESKVLTRAATQAGYDNLADFMSAQETYETQSRELEARYAPIMREIEAGRFGALGSIANLQKNFIAPTAADISDMEQRVIAQRTADIDLATRDAREAALQQANVMGYNPARTVGDIEERRLNQIYDVQQSDGHERALSLSGGEQGLQRNALTTLHGSLGAAISPATAAAGMYGQGVNSMGNLALSQAMATNSALVNAEFFNAQQATAQQVMEMQMRLQALGLGLQGGLADIGGDWQQATSFARGMDQFTSMYGGSTQGSSNAQNPLGFI
jgi:hypothetical protein